VECRCHVGFGILKKDGPTSSHSVLHLSIHITLAPTYSLCLGLPSAALCNWGTDLANTAIFALVFPAVRPLDQIRKETDLFLVQFIILAMHARPMPVDPYSPLPPRKQEGGVRHPSPFVPIRLPIFALVMGLNNLIVRILSVGGGSPPRKGAGRNEITETMEEGGGIDGVPLRTLRTRARKAH
jgi:etoposide-induced 2.4 mRNA